MTKTAAVRSQARRAALTKAAQALPFNPAQALGYAGMLGGGALVGDAGMNGEQSTLKRIGKGVIGAGLAYAGHKALTDQKWQDAIGSGTQKAISYIRGILNKAAETRAEKRALDNVGSEIGGTMAAPLIGGAGGSAVGAIIGAALAASKGKRIAHGAGAGAAAGLSLGVPAAQIANIGGVLTGVVRKRRTKKEQQEHDSKSHWSNLIPGVGAYNYTKRMGRVLAGVGEPDEQKAKKAAEALDSAYVEGFCKAAETLGVDPAALCKQAGLPMAWVGNAIRGFGKTVGRAVTHPRKSFSRLMELGIHGGRDATQRPLADFVNAADTKLEGVKRYFGGLTGARSRALARSGASQWDVNRMRAAEREFRKSVAAGIGVPMAGTIGLVRGVRALEGNQGGQEA